MKFPKSKKDFPQKISAKPWITIISIQLEEGNKALWKTPLRICKILNMNLKLEIQTNSKPMALNSGSNRWKTHRHYKIHKKALTNLQCLLEETLKMNNRKLWTPKRPTITESRKLWHIMFMVMWEMCKMNLKEFRVS